MVNITKLGKSGTLRHLFELPRSYSIPELLEFTTTSYLKNPNKIVAQIIHGFKATATVAVRSSASGEDGANFSHAGEFESVVNVNLNDEKAVNAAIRKVIGSYKKNNRTQDPQDKFFVQKMVRNVSVSGVIFTREVNFGSNYYSVNYDDVSGDTTSVTSGIGQHSNKILFARKNKISSLKSPRFSRLLEVASEIEFSLSSDSLDIEFAIDTKNNIFILQAREMAVKKSWHSNFENEIDLALNSAYSQVENLLKPVENCVGDTTLLGQMPDWNPAEMIGATPSKLSSSLYEFLITDKIWRKARGSMGYYNPVDTKLMYLIAGQPYIDVRASFNSFLPASVPYDIRKKLVNEWISKLSEKSELHDKVEFKIAITCYSFDIKERLKNLCRHLEEHEREKYSSHLKRHLNNLLDDELGEINLSN